MGHEHSSSIVVGFSIEKDDLLMPFRSTRPERFHMEDRFNSRTGEKLASQVKVVDAEEEEVFVFEGTEYEYESEFIEALAEAVGCHISEHGDYCTGDGMMYGIESRLTDETECEGISLSYVAKVEPDLKRIRGAFKERYGLELGEPGIYTLESYG